MKILAIESSCDETSASVVESSNGAVKVLSNITATSLDIHATTGGIIPETAARMQVKYIIPVIVKALCESKGINSEVWEKAKDILLKDIDSIAITFGPGLVGSLLVGVETAKTLSYVFDKPLIPVNHLLAHIYANYINRKEEEIKYPYIGLIVSGGHTDLLLFRNQNDFEWLGGTRDDAAGEAFDKIGRLIDLQYPAGPQIEKRSLLVTNPTIKFKSPLINEDTFDFSFSGLKTEVLRFVQSNNVIDTNLKNQICYAGQKAIIDVLVKKTHQAASKYGAQMILVGGGVSANNVFKKTLSYNSPIPVLFPDKEYSTDNAAMIGAYALKKNETKPWFLVKAKPELYFS